MLTETAARTKTSEDVREDDITQRTLGGEDRREGRHCVFKLLVGQGGGTLTSRTRRARRQLPCCPTQSTTWMLDRDNARTCTQLIDYVCVLLDAMPCVSSDLSRLFHKFLNGFMKGGQRAMTAKSVIGSAMRGERREERREAARQGRCTRASLCSPQRGRKLMASIVVESGRRKAEVGKAFLRDTTSVMCSPNVS